jgi:hypothetical protein
MKEKENMFKSQTNPAPRPLPFAKRQLSMLVLSVWLVALSLVPNPGVQAQTECLGNCEDQLANCIGHSRHIPMLEAICQDSYEYCVDACLGNYAAILG